MRPRIRHDLILIAALLFVAAIALLLFFLFRTPGAYVTVTENGKEVGRYLLSEDRTVLLTTDDGYNRLIIREGRAYIEDADCPDRRCVKMRAVKYRGETLVCLPHGVIVTVMGGKDDGLDAVV